MSKNEDDLLDMTFVRLKEKGILNYFQARFISAVAQAIEKSDINCLKPYKNIYDSIADEIASQIIVEFLLKKNLKLTINTANKEYQDYFQIRDLSVLSSLKLPNKDLSSSESNSLHDLFQCWKETKDSAVKLNKQKMRQEIQEKFAYIDKIDEKRKSILNKTNDIGKKNIHFVHNENEIYNNDNFKHKEYTKDDTSDQQREFLTISKLGFNSQPIFFEDEDEDFDMQIESQLLSLSSTNTNSSIKKISDDDEVEIISSNDQNSSNINIQKRTLSQPIINNPISPKNESKKTIHKERSKDFSNSLKRKKREVVTLIPMRSADLKGSDDTKTSFITKVQTLEILESSSSSDNFFESDVSDHANVLFDIDLNDDNANNKEIANSQPPRAIKAKATDSDDFDDL